MHLHHLKALRFKANKLQTKEGTGLLHQMRGTEAWCGSLTNTAPVSWMKKPWNSWSVYHLIDDWKAPLFSVHVDFCGSTNHLFPGLGIFGKSWYRTPRISSSARWVVRLCKLPHVFLQAREMRWTLVCPPRDHPICIGGCFKHRHGSKLKTLGDHRFESTV